MFFHPARSGPILFRAVALIGLVAATVGVETKTKYLTLSQGSRASTLLFRLDDCVSGVPRQCITPQVFSLSHDQVPLEGNSS